MFLPNLISESTDTITECIPEFDEIVICKNDKNIQMYLEQYYRNNESTIFISSNRVLRDVAANMGFLSIPHFCKAQHILQKNLPLSTNIWIKRASSEYL
ncbi:DNA-binding domain-containing protein [Bacillus thuringiensis]|uniref:DNA-binding domain-containing protein n=1 Tax=Bacillus thuringiensis TaxID=1428 RepID=UPI002FBE347E